MPIALEIGLDAISSYKRLAYTPWHAIAELVDNSTQAYFNNKVALDAIAKPGEEPLTVTISYTPDLLRVEDNAMGMSYDELQNALVIARPPANTSGRSKYGMGLKTSACWIGNLWTVRTKKLGETTEHLVTIDVDKISRGDNDLPYASQTGLPENEHYTIIEITQYNREFKGRTLTKIEQFLSSMYRQDFRSETLALFWRGKQLTWIDLDNRLLTNREDTPYKKDFSFVIRDEYNNEKNVSGWVGILRDGSRSNAGFSILHSGRVVKGWPDSWRPSSLYGQEQGSNNLVNQRLVGEINLDAFEVSHTKDDILWLGDQEEQVENGLLEECVDYRDIANKYRKGSDDRRGPSDIEMTTAVSELQKELDSPELADVVSSDPMLTEELVQETVRSVTESVVTRYLERFSATIGNLTIKGYVESDMSSNDPYVTIELSNPNELIIIVNAAHPHWNQLQGAQGVLNYIRHCTYDGIAEWQALNRVQQTDPDTIKILKDRLLRIPLEMEKHEA